MRIDFICSKTSRFGSIDTIHWWIEGCMAASFARLWLHQIRAPMAASPFPSAMLMIAFLPWLDLVFHNPTTLNIYFNGWSRVVDLREVYPALTDSMANGVKFGLQRMSNLFVYSLWSAGHVFGNSGTSIGHEGLAGEGVAFPADFSRYVRLFFRCLQHLLPRTLSTCMFEQIASNFPSLFLRNISNKPYRHIMIQNINQVLRCPMKPKMTMISIFFPFFI